MGINFKSCSCSLLFTLLCVGTVQTAIGDTCSGTKALPSCEGMAVILSPKKTCPKYYETTSDGSQQCMMDKKANSKCTANTEKKCNLPKPKSE